MGLEQVSGAPAQWLWGHANKLQGLILKVMWLGLYWKITVWRRDYMERSRETEAVWKDRKWEMVIICTTAVVEPGSSRWGWTKMDMPRARVLKRLHDNAAVIWRTSVFTEHECGWVFIGLLVISLLAKRFNNEKPKLWFFLFVLWLLGQACLESCILS